MIIIIFISSKKSILKFHYINDGKKNIYINGIENRIEQIIANLLDNAISFSER